MYIEQTHKWINAFVIKNNLCPFAKQEMERNSIKFIVAQSTDSIQAMEAIHAEIRFLNETPAIETTFIIFPKFLQDFIDYLNFSDNAESLLTDDGYGGIYHLATFHPNYCFADAAFEDVTNYTNRSPYPMIQIIREASLKKASHTYGNIGKIIRKNMAYLRALGLNKVKKLLKESLAPSEKSME